MVIDGAISKIYKYLESYLCIQAWLALEDDVCLGALQTFGVIGGEEAFPPI